MARNNRKTSPEKLSRLRQGMDRNLALLIKAMWAGPLRDDQWEGLEALLAIRKRREQHELSNAILGTMLHRFESCPAEAHHDAMVDRLALLTSDVPGSAVQS